jgi:hypothetical protein
LFAQLAAKINAFAPVKQQSSLIPEGKLLPTKTRKELVLWLNVGDNAPDADRARYTPHVLHEGLHAENVRGTSVDAWRLAEPYYDRPDNAGKQARTS